METVLQTCLVIHLYFQFIYFTAFDPFPPTPDQPCCQCRQLSGRSGSRRLVFCLLLRSDICYFYISADVLHSDIEVKTAIHILIKYLEEPLFK